MPSSEPVDTEQRFTAGNPCPICDGHKGIPVGEDRRCFGFKARSGRICCTRDESDEEAFSKDGEHIGWWHPDPDVNGHKDPPTGRIVAAYDYVDENGDLLYQVVRLAPKDFRQRRPDGKGGWVWNLKDTRLVPYRLPELIAAVGRRDVVNVVEGEKDADAVIEAGGAATCNPMGAGKWQDSFSSYLAGADVRVWADRDNGDGIRHARKVRGSLLGVASSATIVEARSGKDAHDHLAAGHAIDDCAPVRPDQHGRLRLLTLDDAATIAEQPVDWVIPDLLAAGEKAVIAGPPKSLKTWLALHIARCVASAEPVLAREAWAVQERQGVLFVQEEGSAQRWARRLSSVFEGTMDAPFVYTHRGGFSLLNDDHVGWVVDRALDSAARLILLDPWQRITAGIKERDEAETAPAWDAVHSIASATGAAVIVLHHSKKGADLDLEAIRGSSRMAGEVDLAMVLRKKDSEIEVYLDGRDLVRSEEEDGNMIVTYERDRPHMMRSNEFRVSTPETRRNPTREAIVAFLWKQETPVGTSAIREAVEQALGEERKQETVLVQLRKLAVGGHVEQLPNGAGKESQWVWIGDRA